MNSRRLSAPFLKYGWSLWLVSLLTLAGVAGLLAWTVYADYQQAMANGYRLLEQGVRHRATGIAAVVRSAELMLVHLEEDLGDSPGLASKPRSAMLSDRMRQLPEIRALLIVDTEGRVVAATDRKVLGFDATQRDYFTAHLSDSKQPHGDVHRLFISKPFVTVTGVTVVTVSRALHDRSGRFSGVVLASIDPGKFGEVIRSVDSEANQWSLVLHEAGEVIYAVPDHDRFAGQNLAGSVAYGEHVAAGLETTRHLAINRVTGRKTMSVWHGIPETPLIVVASRLHDDLVSEWWDTVSVQVISFVVVAALLLFYSWIAWQRQQALVGNARTLTALNAALEAQQERLKAMAFVDGLTGVANRRRFDEVIDAEWNRCRRDGQPLSVLLIDIDYFKVYNDSYGHQQGDVCLQQVADLFRQHLGRASDFVARYGGEEFACVLPNTNAAGALAKAEELRGAVAARAIPHENAAHAPIVTVSIGVATVIPDAETTPEQLIRRADALLYEAKLAGRNRVMAADAAA